MPINKWKWIPMAITIALAASAQRAEAYYVDYCGGLVPARSWCWSNYMGDHGLITWNRARYPASSCIGVGIVLYRSFTGTFHDEHHACRYVASSHQGLRGYAGVANDSYNRHTVEGKLDLCWGCSLSATGPEAIRAPAEVIAPALDQLAVLRRAAGIDDALSPTVLAGLADADSPLDAPSARRARLADRTDAWYVVPGADVCLFRDTGGKSGSVMGTCAPTDTLAAGELYVVSSRTDDLAPGMVRIAGVAPDGVRAVRVQLVEGGPISELAVTDNVYVGELAGDRAAAPAAIQFVHDDAPPDGAEPTAVDAGGCQAAGGAGSASLLGLAGLGLLVARRRRRR